MDLDFFGGTSYGLWFIFWVVDYRVCERNHLIRLPIEGIGADSRAYFVGHRDNECPYFGFTDVFSPTDRASVTAWERGSGNVDYAIFSLVYGGFQSRAGNGFPGRGS